jgi:acyl-CoA thioester hydrolase
VSANSFCVSFPTRWRDMDNFGHVNNSVYFTYFEQARAMWFETLGVTLTGEGEGPIVVTASCDYLKPIIPPATLEINMTAKAPGRSSFVISYTVRLKEHPDTTFTKGKTKIVWVDYQKGKSIPLPEFIRKRLPD